MKLLEGESTLGEFGGVTLTTHRLLVEYERGNNISGIQTFPLEALDSIEFMESSNTKLLWFGGAFLFAGFALAQKYDGTFFTVGFIIAAFFCICWYLTRQTVIEFRAVTGKLTSIIRGGSAHGAVSFIEQVQGAYECRHYAALNPRR